MDVSILGLRRHLGNNRDLNRPIYPLRNAGQATTLHQATPPTSGQIFLFHFILPFSPHMPVKRLKTHRLDGGC